MIRITVELVSARSPSRNRLLDIAEISNDGTGTRDEGNYYVKLSKWAPKERETWKTGRVIDFPRQVRGAWDLLYLGLKSIVEKRNP